MSSAPLPPLAAIRAFAAAGRHESLRDAAAELGVSASAISHHVRAMEIWTGAALFDRQPRQVRLTATGRALSDQLNAAFGQVRAAMETARVPQPEQKLRVSALPLFTSAWLIPRLNRFKAAHPDLSIEIETTARMVDLNQDPIDIAIRNIRAPTQGLDCHKLMDLRAVPLCAPEIAARLNRVEDLAGESLIHVSGGRDGWAEWFASFGLEALKPRSGLSFDNFPAALEAAAHGQGVVLGLAPLVWSAALPSRLVIPFETPIRSAGAYFLVHRRADRNRASVQAFTAWIRKEMRGPQKRPQER